MTALLTSGEPLPKRHKPENESTTTAVNGSAHNPREVFYLSEENPSHERGKYINTQAGDLPSCERGVDCTETDLMHFAEFWHPTKSDHTKCEDRNEELEECEVVDLKREFTCFAAEVDTQPVFDSEDEEGDSPEDGLSSCDSAGSRLSKTDTVFSRGTSILRSYSILSEEERRELIRRAFELKELLKKELNQTLSIIEEKNRELRRVHSELEHGQLMVKGEVEAMEKNDLVYFPLFAEREYKGRSAAQIHFRLAESQFYRLVDAADRYRVTQVEYVVNPVHTQRFMKAREKLRKLWGGNVSNPVLAFHGTNEVNIPSICKEGFRVPGDANFEHATDGGNYGRGVYFSEFPSYSVAYISGSTKLLLCQVLPGKVFRCSQLIHGSPLEAGYNSHTSPDGKELVIFNPHHILPSYVVHYQQAKGDFQYEKVQDQQYTLNKT